MPSCLSEGKKVQGATAVMSGEIHHLIATYGYWAVGGSITLESAGIPVPAETILIAAAVTAGTTHHLNIGGVITAAAAGAFVGCMVGYLIGREFGYRLLLRYGPRFGISEPRIKLGQFLFLRHGGKVVFFGRFVSVLRTLAAMLAGINGMPWRRFLFFNAAGGVVWALLYGLGGYYLGRGMAHLDRPIAIALGVIALAASLGAGLFIRRHEPALARAAEAALPGPLAPFTPTNPEV